MISRKNECNLLKETYTLAKFSRKELLPSGQGKLELRKGCLQERGKYGGCETFSVLILWIFCYCMKYLLSKPLWVLYSVVSKERSYLLPACLIRVVM